MLIIAHNLAWKLALVVKGQAADADKLLDSYTAEVCNLKILSDVSEFQLFEKLLD
jgi:hypothetical protein